jgi:hypothetical protein
MPSRQALAEADGLSNCSSKPPASAGGYEITFLSLNEGAKMPFDSRRTLKRKETTCTHNSPDPTLGNRRRADESFPQGPADC